MRRSLKVLPLLALASTALPGCVAAVLPALAGSAVAGRQILESDDADSPAPRPAVAERAAPAEAPRVVPAASTPPPAVPLAEPAKPVPSPAAQSVKAEPAPAEEKPAVKTSGFAQMVRYGRSLALARSAQAGSLSAILSDPVALDGQRARCEVGEQHVVLIDLDPAGGVFVPPAAPGRLQGLALGLAVLREARVVIAWISDLSVDESGNLRSALEKSGLDPRGEDIISLRRDGDDRKQARRENLAKTACITTIGGDERADFDERFRYLKNPAAGTELEKVIGDGWFLIDPLFPVDGDTSK